jgi:hypothetical protein
MNTPNENPENQARKGNHPDRTQRAAFWLRAIDARKAKLTREYRKSLRVTAREGVSDEEYAAMLGTLEKMARNLGWDESQPDERPFGRGSGRGFGHGRRHPAMLHGFGHDRHDRSGHDHGGHDDGGHAHGRHDHGDEGHHGHDHRYPGAKRGFRRLHHAERHTQHVTTEGPQA